MKADTNCEDTLLMQRVQQGQLAQLAGLFERNHLSIYHYFLRMGNSPSLAEDLVQETFMKVLVYRQSYHGDASFRAWLYGIARNTAADHYRKSERWPQSEDPTKLDTHATQNLQDDMERDQQHDRFAQALAQLPNDLREILVLHRYQQLHYDDIADLLGLNLNTLKARMRKAVSELHKHYSLLMGELQHES
jgi:RNA polymerase sigma-70 factor (ECF subfamily)